MEKYKAVTNVATEIKFDANSSHKDPFNDLEVDVLVDEPGGVIHRVPCFWSGGNQWKLRFSPRVPGEHRFRVEVTKGEDDLLSSYSGIIIAREIVAYDGDNLLLRRGALRLSENRRYFQHADGTPFLWLADTWWHGMSSRLHWPEEFKGLAADRKAKGFNVIQFVAGFSPDVGAFDPRDTNEAGHSWEQRYERINPAYFDLVDFKVQELVRMGLVPNIFGFWGYHVNWLGLEKTKQHWRYLIARYGAYPVVWTLCGEAGMPWYLADDREQYAQKEKEILNDTARYIKEIDPFHRLLTVHPKRWEFEPIPDMNPIDFFITQSSHDEYTGGIRLIASHIRTARERYPDRPVMLGEALYEGIGGGCKEQIQRAMFWVCMLSGAAGHCYGANGVWQFNRPEAPFSASPTGVTWGNTAWQEAAGWLGSKHVGLGKQLLERYQWWRFEPHPEWIFPAAKDEEWFQPYAAGIPGEIRLFYFPCVVRTAKKVSHTVRKLEPNIKYHAYYLDPITGKEFPVGDVESTPEGEWVVPNSPIFQDFVLVLEA
jgi:hypothetical protein